MQNSGAETSTVCCKRKITEYSPLVIVNVKHKPELLTDTRKQAKSESRVQFDRDWLFPSPT
jgi:hypothetical protein